MRLLLQILLPVLVLVAAGGLVWWMFQNVQKPQTVPPPPNVPLVRAVTAVPQELRLDVRSQGTVEPHAEVALSPQVSGRVVMVAPSLRAGGFFAAGETLLAIEDTDYRLAAVQRRADVARADLRLAQERAEAEAAVRAWKQLEGQRPADPLATRALQVAEAEQALAAAKAAQERADLDLQRTRVSLPFAGRVRSADLAVGQQVQAGAPVATVYGTDVAEVRLPIPADEAAFADLPLGLPDGSRAAAAPTVELTARFGGQQHRWQGVVDRTEGEIDRRTRQLTVVARVEAPYAAGADGQRPPLAVGMFVEATIQGRTFTDVVSLPRAALRQGDTVLVLDAEHRLRARKVEVLRQDRRNALVRGGLVAGERICISVIETFVEGMPVHVVEPDAATPDASSGNGGR